MPAKYEVVNSTPAKYQGTMEKDTIHVIYEYKVKDAYINIEYRDWDEPDVELAAKERQDGKVDENYTTTPKDLTAIDYVYYGHGAVNPSGKFEVDPLTVVYYYRKPTKATVRYIDDDLGIEIIPSQTTAGYIGDEFATEAKDFGGYIYVTEKEPPARIVNMTRDEIIITYYYRRVETRII